MKKTMALATLCWLLLLAGIASAATVDFEEFGGPPWDLGPESYWNGSDGSGGFNSEGAFFNNTYTDYGGGFYAWYGWSVSNMTDTTTPGYENQYSANTGEGADGSEFYAVAYVSEPGEACVELPAGQLPESLMVTNTTYATLSMLYGDDFTDPFGGPTGDDPDWFLLTVTGIDNQDQIVGTVDFYLADYRFDESADDYIVAEWTSVDLAGLSGAATLSFGLSSSDVGPYGLNTPAYFAMDNLVFTPEPASAVLFLVGLVLLKRRKPSCTRTVGPRSVARPARRLRNLVWCVPDMRSKS
jgi:hypothetical protein